MFVNSFGECVGDGWIKEIWFGKWQAMESGQRMWGWWKHSYNKRWDERVSIIELGKWGANAMTMKITVNKCISNVHKVCEKLW
jgi:hypothetical protein